MVVRQIDVAEHARVSTAAVSKVLANPHHPEFTEATRVRIIETAKRLNYIPNRAAAALSMGRSRSISFISAWNIPELQDAVDQQASLFEVGVTKQSAPDRNEAALDRAIRSVLADRPSGLIWLPGWGAASEREPSPLRSAREQARRLGCPVVWLEADLIEKTAEDFVWCDDRAGIEMAIEHLRQQGYHRLVFVENERSEPSKRSDAFAAAVRNAGLESSYLPTLRPTRREDPRVADFVSASPPGTAFLCEADWPAVPVLQAARTLGREVPGELGVMIFGDLRFDSGFSIGEVGGPTISAIRRPFDAIGHRAADLLQDRMTGRYTGEPRREVLPTELIVRESTRRQA